MGGTNTMLTVSELSSFVLPKTGEVGFSLNKPTGRKTTGKANSAMPATEIAHNALPSALAISAPTTSVTLTATKGITAAPAVTAPNAPSSLQVNDTSKKGRSGTERALQQLERSYERMVGSIQLENFDPEKIETYIRLSEKRTGIDMSDKEKDRLKRLASSRNPDILRLLALELRVGIPRRAERDAMAAIGELLLHREDQAALKKFLQDPTKDPNVKAHVRTLLLVNRVEKTMERVDHVRGVVSGFFGR